MNAFPACLAEFIGTFALIFVGAGSICLDAFTGGHVGLVGVALAHGMTIAVMVSATGHLSGGHLNPAVTAGVLAAGKIKPDRACLYVVAQLLGGTVAALLLRKIFSWEFWEAKQLGTPMLTGVGFMTGIAIEAILTFFLVFVVFGSAVDARGPKIGGLAIGMTVSLDILVGGPLTGASMNPARTFGPAFAAFLGKNLQYNPWENHLVYWIGPLLGGIVAGGLYKAVYLKDPE